MTIGSFRECRTVYFVSELCAMHNRATAPYVLRTDHEHNRNRMLARAIMGRLRRMGAYRGVHYHEAEDGRLLIQRRGV